MEASVLGGDLHAAAPVWLRKLRRFLVSPAFMLMLAMVECAATALHWQIPVAVGFVVLTVLILVVSDDVFATTCPFLLLTVLVSYCHEDNPYEIFIGFIWLAIPVVAALLFHFIYYRGRYRIGYSFAGLMAVSVGTTLGGVGCLSAAEYFRPATLYYVFGLGFGMVGLYLILKAQLARRRDYDPRLLLLTALYVAAACAAFFTLHFYAERLVWMQDDLKIYGHLRLISIDNRNVFATYMLLGLPAPFYFAQRGRGWHLLGGLGLLAALLLTGSRGGLLMGVALFGLCFLYLLRRDVRHRRRNLVLLAMLAVAALAAGGFLLKFFSFRFENGFIEGNEPRVLLLKRAVEDFLGHPVFGVGLGYTGNADIYNPKTVRAAMGSLFRVDVRVCSDIAADISRMRGEGFRVYAAMLDKSSRDVCELELENGKIGFVIGNEGHGVSESVRSACTGSVIVPMCDGPESLNAAICSSLLSWEVFRARR